MSKNENLSIKHVYNNTFIIVKNKGHIIYTRPLFFTILKCAKFDPNCPYAISCYDPNFDPNYFGLKRFKTV